LNCPQLQLGVFLFYRLLKQASKLVGEASTLVGQASTLVEEASKHDKLAYSPFSFNSPQLQLGVNNTNQLALAKNLKYNP